MRESTERVAELGDVDVETFGLFAEFCYTRNYRAPSKAKTNKAVAGVRVGCPSSQQITSKTPYSAQFVLVATQSSVFSAVRRFKPQSSGTAADPFA
jgi:hypothetical protein